MYKVKNNVEDKIVFEGNESEFIDFVKKIVIENEDFDFSVLGVSDANEYIEDYCGNLEMVKTFRITYRMERYYDAVSEQEALQMFENEPTAEMLTNSSFVERVSIEEED
jgi:hypothetical protein